MFFTGFQSRNIICIAAALTIGIGAIAYEQVHAAVPTDIARLEVAATALKPAKRVAFPDTVQTGPIMFPMEATPTCYLSKTSFGQPRSNGTRTHEGIDLMASLGQDVYAVDNGVLWKQWIDGPTALLSGNAWYVQLADKTYYFYGHLSAFAPGLKVGDTVTKGQVIGYVGDTGNAGLLNYHLHFEVHPKGGAAVDPFPLLTIPKACTVSA